MVKIEKGFFAVQSCFAYLPTGIPTGKPRFLRWIHDTYVYNSFITCVSLDLCRSRRGRRPTTCRNGARQIMAVIHRPALLVILDGWGYREDDDSNAIKAARKPVWDRLWREHPHTLIRTSGAAVGLPGDQMGRIAEAEIAETEQAQDPGQGSQRPTAVTS